MSYKRVLVYVVLEWFASNVVSDRSAFRGHAVRAGLAGVDDFVLLMGYNTATYSGRLLDETDATICDIPRRLFERQDTHGTEWSPYVFVALTVPYAKTSILSGG